MTLVKDTLDKLIPAISPSSSQPAADAKAESGSLRSDAVSLEVPVKVHGSRVTEVTGESTPHTEPFEEHTSTMIVFPQGGVLKMSTAVNQGQMVVVTNLKSGQDSICRVVKVRAYATQNYVEVEFTHRQVGYWGVQFSSDVIEPPKKPLAVPQAPVAPSVAFIKPSAPQVKPALVNRAPVSAAEGAKPPSSFVTFGAQEDIQLAASPTTASKPRLGVPAIEPSRQAAPPAPLKAMDNDKPVLILEDSPALDHSQAAKPAPVARCFGESTNLVGIASSAGARPQSREMFGVPLDSGKVANEGKGSNPLVLTAVAIGLLAVVGAGGYFFLRQHSDVPVTSVQQSGSSVPAPVGAENSLQPAAQVASNSVPEAASSSRTQSTVRSVPARSSAVVPASPVVHGREPALDETKQPTRGDGVSAPEVSSAAPAATEQRHSSGNTPSLFGALNAHPVASHSATQESEAPAVPVSETGNLPVLSQSLAGTPMPQTRVSTAPRLISSVLPVYPDFARQRGIDGTVVIQATIEANGTVGTMKVLSGPLPLRNAALEAVRHWKYDAGTIDGQKAATDITLSLHFNAK